MTDRLVAPHGGRLVDLLVDASRTADLHAAARDWPSWTLSDRQLCDLELLATGGFSPLTGFLGRADYESVCERLRLADGTLWPIPVTLDVPAELATALEAGSSLALRDPEGVMLAALHVEESWVPDREREARQVFATTDPTHPGVAQLLACHPCYVGGRLEVVTLPAHHDFVELRRTPATLRHEFADRGWERVVAFQTRNPMHRAHVELTIRAAKEVSGGLLIHPVVGMTKPGDVDHFTRVRCYEAVLPRYPEGSATLALLPLAMRMGGPREAVWHAIIRKNHGCSHLIVGRDHAGPQDVAGRPFYGPYDAQSLLRGHEEELGLEMVPFRTMVYLAERDAYMPLDEVPEGSTPLTISGTELRELLRAGRDIPDWFTYPEVAAELRRTYPPRSQQGFAVLFTGLSGAGKSTLANGVAARLLEVGGRAVTLLDGDIVRTHLSSELGFSKEHRDLNIRRIGYVASEVARGGGVAICAPIAPYDAVRKEVRRLVESAGGGFLLVHVATSLEVCEQRDRKGLYARARAGLLTSFTGIDDPYELPDDADLTLDAARVTPAEAVSRVIELLQEHGYLQNGAQA